MKYFTFILSLFAINLTCTSSVFAAEELSIGMVNLADCMSQSKLGQQEQETLQNIHSQMISLMEDASKELKEINNKLEDPDYLDSLSPQAEAELRTQGDQLNQNINQYKNQFPQVMQQAQYQTYQRVISVISQAAEEIAKKHGLSYILNKETCLYIRPDRDVTNSVIEEMDRTFDLNEISKKESDTSNTEDMSMLEIESPAKAG